MLTILFCICHRPLFVGERVTLPQNKGRRYESTSAVLLLCTQLKIGIMEYGIGIDSAKGRITNNF